jgi:hypothetical protein
VLIPHHQRRPLPSVTAWGNLSIRRR